MRQFGDGKKQRTAPSQGFLMVFNTAVLLCSIIVILMVYACLLVNTDPSPNLGQKESARTLLGCAGCRRVEERFNVKNTRSL